MAKRRKTLAINGEFRLPEVLIQRIQSFLTGKEAAQTTILSKSWYKAWLTRPNLDLDEQDFAKKTRSNLFFNEDKLETIGEFNNYLRPIDKFLMFTKKTIQRYEELNLKIESFSLCIKTSLYKQESDIVIGLILKALKMSATRHSFRFELFSPEFVLPHEVLGSDNLVRLSVKGCKIDLGTEPKVRCTRLESLVLSSVKIENDMISNILFCCPFIQTLSLCHINEFGKQGLGSVFDGPISRHKFHKVRCLELLGGEFDPLFFDDLSSKFPSLKDLTIACRRSPHEMRISSRSIESLYFSEQTGYEYRREQKKGRLMVKFDLPSIRKFTFVGLANSHLRFKSTSREWESHITIRRNHPTNIWFRQLSKFLTKLSRSKIHLSLNIRSNMSFDYDGGDIQGLPKHDLENLTVDTEHLTSLICSALFDGLFRLCRPKFITQSSFSPESRFGGKTNNDFLCKTLVRAMGGNCSVPSHCMYGLHDLEEVNVEIFEENVAEWRSFPLKLLLDACTSSKYKQQVRFQLKWRRVA